MPRLFPSHCTRRGFFESTAELFGTLALGRLVVRAWSKQKELPRRRLGRTGVEVSALGLGLGPAGLAGYSRAELQELVQSAFDEGVTYFDVQPDYGNAEEYLGLWLRKNRDQVFVVTKVWAKTKPEALASVQQSVKRLSVEHVDAVLVNNIGDYDLQHLFASEGAFAGLEQARKQGLTRFLGISGHMGTDHFVQALQTGKIDIVMPVVNFVDRYTYRMEEKVLPVAAEHDVGVAAMKVLGGALGWNYETRQQRAALPREDHATAIRYALGTTGVTLAVIGCKSAEEVRLAAGVARDFRPLEPQELQAVLDRGRRLAAEWGPHFGPA